MNLMSNLAGITRSPSDPEIVETGPSSRGTADNAARALGWMSIGLGLAELLAPGRITRALGVEGSEGLVRAMGLREIGHGVACLSVDREIGVKSRVAGDGLDLLALGVALASDRSNKRNIGLALAAVAGITIADVVTADALARRHSRGRGQPRDYSDRSGWPQGRPHLSAPEKAASTTPAADAAAPPAAQPSPAAPQGMPVGDALGQPAGWPG